MFRCCRLFFLFPVTKPLAVGCCLWCASMGSCLPGTVGGGNGEVSVVVIREGKGNKHLLN